LVEVVFITLHSIRYCDKDGYHLVIGINYPTLDRPLTPLKNALLHHL